MSTGSMAFIRAAERGRERHGTGSKITNRDRIRKRTEKRRRSLMGLNTDQKKVLIISESVSTSGVMSDLLRKDPECRFEVYLIQDPLMALRAVVRYHPDVIVADNWYRRSERDYWDVMLPVLDLHPEIKVVVVAEKQNRGRKLPQKRWYFNDAPVLDKVDATSGDNLAETILSIV